MYLEEIVESLEDLTDMGLNKMEAKLLYKRINEWKKNGLPKDFSPSAAPLPTLSQSPLPVTASLVSAKQLDDDFTAIQCNTSSSTTTERIFAAAAQGDHLADAYLGILYAKGSTALKADPVLALKYSIIALPWLRTNAASGNRYAQFVLASCHIGGRGVDKDEKEAFRFLKLAADQGHAISQYNVGVYYQNGTVGNIDSELAFQYFQLAADQGLSLAEYTLGVLYQSGKGFSVDDAKSFKYFKRAADQGHPLALYNVGVYLRDGKGTSIDNEQSMRYFQLAATKGYAEAELAIGVLYQKGHGVSKCSAEALKHFIRAAEGGVALGAWHRFA